MTKIPKPDYELFLLHRKFQHLGIVEEILDKKRAANFVPDAASKHRPPRSRKVLEQISNYKKELADLSQPEILKIYNEELAKKI